LAAALGTLSATTGAATLSAAAKVLVGGALAATTGAATLSAAGKVLVGGTLSKTTDPVGLAATGTVFGGGAITGTLALTLAPAVLIRPSVPPRQIGVPGAFPKGLLPIIQGGAEPFAQKQFDQIRNTLQSTLILMPQSATSPPTTLIDGMKRLARAPWRPVAGQGADAWVYWDAVGQVWRFLSDAPSNT